MHGVSAIERLGDEGVELSEQEFHLLARLLYEEAGIRLGDHKMTLVSSRLQKRLAALGFRSFYSYYRHAKLDEEERSRMVEMLSTHTTFLFRERHHFKFLAERVLPELIAKRPGARYVRIWSAGCSSGEETYTIALTLWDGLVALEQDPAHWDVQIIGTDIAHGSLARAKSGVYEDSQIPDTVERHIVKAHFLKGHGASEGKIRVKDHLRPWVHFRQHSLGDDVSPDMSEQPYDVVFCRNVLIYFDEAMKRRAFDSIAQRLAPQGFLFIGHSETIFERGTFSPVSTTVYRKTGR